MIRHVGAAMAAAFALAFACANGQAAVQMPSSITPLRTVNEWFRAINAKDARKVRSYLTTAAWRDWSGRPPSEWSSFTHLHCKQETHRRSSASVKCTFHESKSPTEGNPDTFWSVYLHHTRRRWLIFDWGQP
jgi:hypothetical protein